MAKDALTFRLPGKLERTSAQLDAIFRTPVKAIA